MMFNAPGTLFKNENIQLPLSKDRFYIPRTTQILYSTMIVLL